MKYPLEKMSETHKIKNFSNWLTIELRGYLNSNPAEPNHVLSCPEIK
jgi:hypothetical protein